MIDGEDKMKIPYCVCKEAIGRGTHVVCGKEDEKSYKISHPISYAIYKWLTKGVDNE